MKDKELKIRFDLEIGEFWLENIEYTPDDVHYASKNDSIDFLINLLRQGFIVRLSNWKEEERE